ncbi:hypothetical protein V493_08096 [Pseudogymnoascus sp. VKM F-4281 (FW-2241)]|nr:hypothetical protein V493_08096 [Pseudogymnoascus sp. VKM F-4281 (FW-2241)]
MVSTKQIWPLVLVASLFDSSQGAVLERRSSAVHDSPSSNSTASTPELNTWWHPTGEINTKTPVDVNNVRQSHLYTVQVATATAPKDYYDSFVYETIPRNGNGKICLPGDLESLCDEWDQITLEVDVGITMGWTQFLYGSDVVVKVSRNNDQKIRAEDVVIRPSNLDYNIKTKHGDALITVPYNPNGVRFSVEIKDDLFEYRIGREGEGSQYVQNEKEDGFGYVPSYNDSMPIVGVEPRNALLIFASPFPTEDLIPNDEANTLRVEPGLVTGLDQTDKSIVYFAPGVYHFTAKAHAVLAPSVTWVYIAPGAYVKGAIEYNSPNSELKATGFGVLSGEQYVYQANTAEGYTNVKSDATSLRLWRGNNVEAGATWTLHGLTSNSPPFNSMDFFSTHAEEIHEFSIHASDYKQVGAFFGQTDGIQMYPNSHVHDVFYHAGDDVIKTYYSNVLAERIVAWKTNTAPIIQFGWYQRNLTNITVDHVDLIHSRYISQQTKYPYALVGSSASYTDDSSTSTADTGSYISHYTVSNWRAEGHSPALFGVNPLSNIDTFTINNVWIESLEPRSTNVGRSMLSVFTDASDDNKPVLLGENSPNNIGLLIKDFYVGDEHITLEAGNWDLNSLGNLNFDEAYLGRWTAE